jgi:hypothetical protein
MIRRMNKTPTTEQLKTLAALATAIWGLKDPGVVAACEAAIAGDAYALEMCADTLSKVAAAMEAA